MRVSAFGLLVAIALGGAAAEAQTVTGRIAPVWDAENERYTYGPLYWDIEVAPRSARSDEFSLYLYYNKRAAVMSAGLVCQARGEEPEDHALSFSGEHFLSLTTGLFPERRVCSLSRVSTTGKKCCRIGWRSRSA